MTTNVKPPKASSPDIDHELIAACKRGEHKAMFQIYKLYYKAMYNISLKIVNDPVEAEDIMQESFLTAFEQIGSYRGEVNFGVWLKEIVQNRSIDLFRITTLKGEKL